MTTVATFEGFIVYRIPLDGDRRTDTTGAAQKL